MPAIDSLEVVWPSMKKQVIWNPTINALLTVNEKEATEHLEPAPRKAPAWFSEVTPQVITGKIRHVQNEFVDFDIERLMPRMLSREGPKLAVADVNGDSLEDFFVGSAKRDTAKLFWQMAGGKFIPSPQPAFNKDALYEEAGSVFLDIDSDGDQDLLVSSGGNLNGIESQFLQIRLYLNDGKGNYQRNIDRLPDIRVNASCIAGADFDGDGDMDAFVGGRTVPGKYGLEPKSYLLQNNRGILKDVTQLLAPELQTIGRVTDAVWVDVDNDQRKELVLTGEWMPITILKNTTEGLLFSGINNQFTKTNGWWNCIKAADLDNDGDINFVMGNLGLNSKIKADIVHPARLFVNDFDKNGTSECLLTYYKPDGRSYLLPMRGELVTQLPAYKERLLKFADFAGKTTEEVIPEKDLYDASKKEAYQRLCCINQANL
jgi:hypothetical protein